MEFQIQGVIVPLLTPLTQDGAIDRAGVSALVDFLVTRGVHGLFPGGTTGEGVLLTTAERMELAEAVVSAAAGRVPVIVHTGALTTDEARRLTAHAQASGAAAAALLPPFYYRYDDDGLFRYFATVAQSVPDFPLFLYNFPGVTGNVISAELVARLVEACPNIVGMKDSSGALSTLMACAPLHAGQFIKTLGSDGLILGGVAMGVDGCVSGNANVVPELVVALYHAAAAGQLAEARVLQAKLDQVRALLGDGAKLALFKGVLACRGIEVGPVRAPLATTSAQEVDRSWNILRELDLGFV